MIKKDRIAIVVSLLIVLLSCFTLSQRGLQVHFPDIFVILIVFSYWSYRFIKNDLSFIRFKDE
jgi:hypothetical protein